ncbi:hypothetical protein JMUB5056_0428 [Leptotrichia hongkongensis]|uniref:Uncharacterized protein n=1 Tax=Leptotrichia hongkongensis TaxID=554406 RepID=A0A510L4V8_9FUSO|nr:hypothetical protein [Leptotrichia hongkongensis]BBM58846.1 hypothetical protein JMUB5056_0428 [Leptotrichia hongkongensis]
MGLDEKIQEFKMLWSEKLIKLGIAIFLIGLIVFLFKGSEIFDQLFLIILLVGVVVLLKINFEFNRKVVILKDILVYYEDGRECHRAKITGSNIKTYYKEKRAYRSRYKCKYMSINKFEIPIYSLGLKASIELEKAIYEIQYKKNNTVIKNRLFTIPRERLIKEKFGNFIVDTIVTFLLLIMAAANANTRAFFLIVYLIIVSLNVFSLIKLNKLTPKTIKVTKDVIIIDNVEYNKSDIKEIKVTNSDIVTLTTLFKTRRLKITGKFGKRIFTLGACPNSEFKNFRKDMIYENYERLYKEIVKFCVKNEIEYELV